MWRAGSGAAPRGVCVLLNGFSEFVEKYNEVAGELCARGFAVASFDWRGQGASARALDDTRKGHVRDFAEFDSDLAAFLDSVVAPLGLVPRLALAHSMGGHILLRRLHDRPRDFACAVLTAPMLGIQTGNYPRWFTRALTQTLNLAGPSPSFVWGAEAHDPATLPFEGNDVTSDPARFARAQEFLQAHPAMQLNGPTFGWLGAALRSMTQLQADGFAEAITMPFLVFGAGRDRIADVAAVRAFAHRLPAARYIELADSQHEILMENDSIRARFWKEFDEFVRSYVS